MIVFYLYQLLKDFVKTYRQSGADTYDNLEVIFDPGKPPTLEVDGIFKEKLDNTHLTITDLHALLERNGCKRKTDCVDDSPYCPLYASKNNCDTLTDLKCLYSCKKCKHEL